MAARWILCESGDDLLLALRRVPGERSVGMWRTRTPREALEALRQTPDSVLLVALTRTSAEAVLELLLAVKERFQEARALVVLAPGLECYEGLVRELGAAHVVVSARDLTEMAEIARRHLELAHAAIDNDPGHAALSLSRLTEQILADLPWADET